MFNDLNSFEQKLHLALLIHKKLLKIAFFFARCSFNQFQVLCQHSNRMLRLSPSHSDRDLSAKVFNVGSGCDFSARMIDYPNEWSEWYWKEIDNTNNPIIMKLWKRFGGRNHQRYFVHSYRFFFLYDFIVKKSELWKERENLSRCRSVFIKPFYWPMVLRLSSFPFIRFDVFFRIFLFISTLHSSDRFLSHSVFIFVCSVENWIKS